MDSKRPSKLGKYVGVLIVEPNLSQEPRDEAEASHRVQSLQNRIQSVVRRTDDVGRIGFHHVYAICQLQAANDLRIIGERIRNTTLLPVKSLYGIDIHMGGVAFDAAEAFDSHHMLQMALLRLDVARRSSSGVDIVICDVATDPSWRFDSPGNFDSAFGSPHFEESANRSDLC